MIELLRRASDVKYGLALARGHSLGGYVTVRRVDRANGRFYFSQVRGGSGLDLGRREGGLLLDPSGACEGMLRVTKSERPQNKGAHHCA